MTHRMPSLAILSVVLAALAAPGTARAQDSNASASGSVTVIEPLTLSKFDDLHFGTAILSGGAAATITIDPDLDPASAVSSTGPVLVSGAHAARFGGATVQKTGIIVRVPKGTIPITRIGGSEQLLVRDFTVEGGTRKRLEAGESFAFRVGGTIDLPDGTPDGVYQGTFTVDIQYP